MRFYQDYVLNDKNSAPINGATVTVRVGNPAAPGTGALATIYSDDGVTTIAGSAVTTATNGRFSFYAPDGKYDLTVTGTGVTATTQPDVEIADFTEFVATDTEWTAPNLKVNKELTQVGMAAPAVAPTGQGRLYFDSTSNKLRLSQNAGAYADVSTGGTADQSNPVAADGIQYVKNGGADANDGFSWASAKTASVAGLSSAHGALPSTGGLIHSAGNATFATDPFAPFTKNVQILLVNGVWTFNANAVCPPNVSIRVMKGASISVATGVTVDMGSYIDDNFSTITLAGTGALNQKYSGHEIFAASYGVKADTKRVTNASTTISSGIVTVPAAQFTSADVGKAAWAMFSNQAAIIAASTISTVNSSTSITLSNTASSTNSGNVTLVWGTDDSNALIAAYTAAKNAGTTGGGALGTGAKGSSRARLQLPAGLILFSKFLFGINGTTEFAQVEIVGQGADVTVFVPSPGFTVPTQSAILHEALNSGYTILRDFGFDAQEVYFATALGKNVITQGRAEVFNLHLARASNQSPALTLFGFATSGARTYNLRIEGSLVTGAVVTANNQEAYGLEVANNGGASAHQLRFVNASDFHWFGGLLDETPSLNCANLENSKRIVFEGVRVVTPTPAASNGIAIDGTSSAVLIGCTIFGGSLATGDGLDVAAGGEARILASRFEHINATGFAINNAGTVYDLGGNVIDAGKYSGGARFSDVARLRPNGTALVAADIALGAGWGAGATVTAVTGTDQGFDFTVTAAGVPAINPTITPTFKDGTWTLAPILIIIQRGGTGATARIDYTPSATAPVITWGDTPVAGSTYIFSVICMGR